MKDSETKPLGVFALPAVFDKPLRVVPPYSWAKHIPFAFWIIAAARPRLLVELGTYGGTSFSAFCQGAFAAKVNAKCYAIDNWIGDEHANYYGEQVYSELLSFVNVNFGELATLIRSSFDEALNHFEDGTIDLLHIDGLHTYEAVKHDFETWKRKLSSRSIVIFHDTNVRERDFGVWKFWEEISQQYPSVSFAHGHGLGVLFTGTDIPSDCRELAESTKDPARALQVQSFFARMGEHIQRDIDFNKSAADNSQGWQSFHTSQEELKKAIARITELDAVRAHDEQRIAERERAAAQSIIDERISWMGEVGRVRGKYETQLEKLTKTAATAEAQLKNFEASEAERKALRLKVQDLELRTLKSESVVEAFHKSRSYRWTAPLRGLTKVLRHHRFNKLRSALRLGYWALTFQLQDRLRQRREARMLLDSELFDFNWYLKQYPDVGAFGVNPLAHYLTQGAAEGRNPHLLFDSAYYLRTYPDVSAHKTNPLVHFAQHGAAEKRNPHPFFDMAFYLASDPQAASSKWNPIVHFMKEAHRQKVSPHPLFAWEFYVSRYPDAAATPNAFLHFYQFGAAENRMPHILFDPEYYLKVNSDLPKDTNAFKHFLEQGGLEHRNCHPLFDVQYYLSHYGADIPKGTIPLVHFILEGYRKGYNPHPLFDTIYYQKRYPDIAEIGINPIEHYLLHGGVEGREPSPHFSAAFYRWAYSDVTKAGANPLAHYVTSGKAEGRKGAPAKRFTVPVRREEWEKLLPSEAVFCSPKMKQPIAIVIPVYRGFEVTKRCIESVLASKDEVESQVILVNDCSPEVEVTEYLRTHASNPRVTLIENEKNLGFVVSVNAGMAALGDSDVVLLNSDAQVPSGWLDRLAAQAYSDHQVATVTPFSNNATICSFPTLEGFAHYMPGDSLESIDAACRAANSGRSIQIPTAVGFCMYIRRSALEDVGDFDAAAFGRGYGEENDFCLRATMRGWKHFLATDLFVFHEGEQSFKDDSAPGKLAAMEILRSRYPHYEGVVAKHVEEDPAAAFRIAAWAARLKLDTRPVVLVFAHSFGGGTERHVQEVLAQANQSARFLILRSAPFKELSGDMVLQVHGEGDRIEFAFAPEMGEEFVIRFLKSCGVVRAHVHHTIGSGFSAAKLLRALNVPYDITIHDYYTICPQVNLTTVSGDYCGEPSAGQCAECIMERPSWSAFDITWWRLQYRGLIRDADRVFCPSIDARQRISRYIPDANYLVLPHDELSRDEVRPWRPSLGSHEPLRIAVLGAVSAPKGARIVAGLVRRIKENNLPIKVKLLGFLGAEVECMTGGLLEATGGYSEDELPQLIADFNPHLIWFPARWPETFSYTLSTALDCGRAVVAPRIGAFIERLQNRELTWLVDWNLEPDALTEFFLDRRAEFLKVMQLPILNAQESENRPNRLPVDFYRTGYLTSREFMPLPKLRDLRSDGKRISVLLVTEMRSVRYPTPCAYIRLILPLTDPAVAANFDLHVVTPEEALQYKADILLTHRLAVESPKLAEGLIDHCRGNGIRLIYDIDDDIFGMAADPNVIKDRGDFLAALRLVVAADQVWCSTAELQRRMTLFNPSTVVIENSLDPRLWKQDIAPRPYSDPTILRMVYMGTRTHSADLRMITPALERIHSEFGERVTLEIIGVVASPLDAPSWAKQISVPLIAGDSYPAFTRWLQRRPQYDIGLCPLQETIFNSGKSNIKLQDYAALGVAAVCSDVGPYHSASDGETCLRVENTEDAWYAAIKRLIDDRELRLKLQRGASESLEVQDAGKAPIKARLSVLRDLLQQGSRLDAPVVFRDASANTDLIAASDKNIFRAFLSRAFIRGTGIEIGALQNPLPVIETARVTYVDRLSKKDLCEHYPELGNVNLVDPDIIDDGQTLPSISSESQDFVIANHFLEHCENPLLALENFIRVLKVGGCIFLALPDKRFTFDRDRQTTTLDHLITDYRDGPTGSRRGHFEEWAVQVEPHFGRHHEGKEAVDREVDNLLAQDYSIHFHNWTPKEVREFLDYSQQMLEFPLRIEYFLSYEEEMVILLRKVPAASDSQHSSSSVDFEQDYKSRATATQ